jgi:tetratricopeptide (TPR) repeat protein
VWFNALEMIQRVWFSFAAVVAAFGIFAAVPQKPAANPSDKSLAAARLNNLGAAYMNQQLFEKGLKAFQDAAALDPKLQIAQLNVGIALLNLTRMEPAKDLLEAAVKRDPKDPHSWFNLGLLYKNSNNPEGAIDAFRHVVEIDPDDSDSWYFLGATYSQSRQFPQAIDAFQHALKLNPLHASAEFGIARAYQQSGDTSRSREHLQRFQHITQAKLGTPIGLAYGDQGKYSLAEESPAGAQKALPAIAVHFVDATDRAGLTARADSSALSGTTQPPAQVPGACFLDYDGDGRPDLLLTGVGKGYALRLYHNEGEGKFRDVTQPAGLETGLRSISCTAGDYDNDGAADFAVSTFGQIALFHNEKNGKFTDVTAAAGVAPSAGAYLGLAFVDYDHDGDLDLYVTGMTGFLDSKMPGQQGDQHPRPGNIMFRNNGNGTFTEVTEATGLNGETASFAAVGIDYNNDRAVDLLLTGNHPQIFENPREGKFPVREPWIALASAPTAGVAVLDFNHDGWMDVAFTHSAAPGLTLWRNNQGKNFGQDKVPTTNWVRGFGVAAVDYDNDGWIDLVATGESAEGRGEVRLFRNLGSNGFKDVTADVGLDKIQFKNPRAIITGDYDNDGATDLLVTQNQGPAVLLRNEGGNKNNWVRLNFKGLADNKSGIGTKVEVFAGGNRQKWEIAGSNGYLGQNSTEIIAGLGQAKEADVVRMLWPSGVLQDEIEVAGLKEHSFVEMDRRGSSCPTLFAWDGTHYALVGDMLGAGVFGHWVAPGQRNVPRPVEYIKIDRNLIREKENPHPSQNARRVGHPELSQSRGNVGHSVLSFRFMEPLEEAVYLDQVNLLAVDHAAGVEVYPNEYFASNPPYPEFKVVFSRDARPPAGAWDEHGHDVLPHILAHRYFGDFQLTEFKGFAKPHTLELDLGEPYQGGPLWLLMHGEIEYFTATGMYAADQAGIQGVSPYVEALGEDGKWKRAMDDLGFPAGGARTMTADLTGKLPQGTRRIRITTNLQIYWDDALISRTRQDQNFHLTPVALGRADLRFHGFPLKIEGDPPGNVKYVYEKASATGPYTRPVGAYTRYGDVLPLLTANDDRMAIFGSGDEIALDFDPSNLPNLPQGWVRDYFFTAQGYEKDMDFYAADSNTVDPLPFRSMGTYPYQPQKFPPDNSRLNYLLNYNTRHLSGNEPRGYSFDYGSAQ